MDQNLAVEACYKIKITDWTAIKPDFQYIFSPSGMVPDAAVATVRVEIDF